VNFSIKRHNSFKTQNHRPSRPWISTAYRKRKNVFGRNDELLHSYLIPIDADIDYLVLGHYPYLIPQIKEILPNHIQIIDSGEAVAKQTQSLLQEKSGLQQKKIVDLLSIPMQIQKY
jgi:glutamate racemase